MGEEDKELCKILFRMVCLSRGWVKPRDGLCLSASDPGDAFLPG